jgi:hypothetical protein
MKKIGYSILVLILALILVFMYSCARNKIMVGCSHARSSFSGLNRTITWVGSDKEIKRWEGVYRVEYSEGSVRLIDLKTSKTIVLGGNYCIEEQ